MDADHRSAIETACDALAAAIIAAVRAEVAEEAKRPDRLLSIGDAAAMLGIGRSMVYAELGAGRLRSFKVGGRRLIPSSAITEFIAASGR